ncbi:hypothetical protein IP78_03440 [Brevundimonas sp. AAP58]|uniref:hypothetical protein n=1 Tax=Brevundimonas sp. AAP58 TaxID=1523422 RepID=UPI0006B971EA|nr:hypothetical protein [Brevundimonas sp. AAP58]KPF82926.1 hypothetical protein IP78_03440 [Brevundimonas sp. AAP58]
MSLIARRPRLIAAAAVTAVAGLALAGWTFAPRTDAEGRALGPRIAIDLVTPPEPEIVEGGILDVGQINDGFDDAALDRVAVVEDPTFLPEEAYAGPDHDLTYLPRMPLPRPVALEDLSPGELPVRPRRDALDDGSRWFGLDQLLARAPARGAESAPMSSGPERDRHETDQDKAPPSFGPRPYYADRYEYSSE